MKADAEILLVDDDIVILSTLAETLGSLGYRVTTAECVTSALQLILSHPFDVLLSDLHMPRPGDGLTVISAMRHANPKAVTILLTSFPEMDVAAETIVRQADEIILKGCNLVSLAEAIDRRLALGPPEPKVIQPIVTILESSIQSTIAIWLRHVEQNETLRHIALSPAQRTEYLPGILGDLIHRIRAADPLGRSLPDDSAARRHGARRRLQGYSAAMLICESGILQISILETLRRNLDCINCSTLLDSLITVAGEVEASLQQAVAGYLATNSPLEVEVPTQPTDHSRFPIPIPGNEA